MFTLTYATLARVFVFDSPALLSLVLERSFPPGVAQTFFLVQWASAVASSLTCTDSC